MFKCKECGNEYDIKPDYCDCGNDTFEEIAAAKPENQEPEPKSKPTIAPVPEQKETPQFQTKKKLKKHFPNNIRSLIV